MDKWEAFCIGIGFGALASWMLWHWTDSLYHRILREKATDKAWPTPEKIGNEFYFIVPEREYLELRQKP